MKKHFWAPIALSLLLIFTFSDCKADFVGNKIKIGNKYTLSFFVLNTTEKETLTLENGQTLNVSLELEEGSVSLSIAQKDKEPAYRGTDLDKSADFSVTVPESGKYIVLVSGKGAKGEIKFEVYEK